MTQTMRRLLFLLLGLTLTSACDCSCGSSHGGDGSVGDAATGDGSVGDATTGDASAPTRPDVRVLITADNAYGFGYGDANGLSNYFMGIEDNGDDIFVCSAQCDDANPCAVGVCDTFGTCNADRQGPETYVVPGSAALPTGYLYVIVWSDESVTQGLIGQFTASDGFSPTVYTGASAWQVCATGVDIDLPDPDPSLADINTQIARCNETSGNTTFSGGWIGNSLGNNPKGNQELVVLSDTAGEPAQFANLCRGTDPNQGDMLDPEARWMWFDDDRTAMPDGFHSNGSPRGDFLIFRLPIAAVVIE